MNGNEVVGFNGYDHCYYCGKLMTEEDKDNYDPIMCCSGQECGCQGMPTDPPYCIKCSSPMKVKIYENLTKAEIMEDIFKPRNYDYHECKYCSYNFPDMYDECTKCGTVKNPDEMENDD